MSIEHYILLSFKPQYEGWLGVRVDAFGRIFGNVGKLIY